jgi:hypothetical protein
MLSQKYVLRACPREWEKLSGVLGICGQGGGCGVSPLQMNHV